VNPQATDPRMIEALEGATGLQLYQLKSFIAFHMLRHAHDISASSPSRIGRRQEGVEAALAPLPVVRRGGQWTDGLAFCPAHTAGSQRSADNTPDDCRSRIAPRRCSGPQFRAALRVA